MPCVPLSGVGSEQRYYNPPGLPSSAVCYGGSHQREEDRLANSAGTGEQLQKAVDTESDTTGRWHPVLQGAEEVLVQLHRLGIARRGQLGLCRPAGPLHDRVRQLRISGAELDTARRRGPTSRPAGSVRCARASGEVSTGKSRTNVGGTRVVLNQLLEQFLDHLARHPSTDRLDAIPFRDIAQTAQWCGRGHLLAQLRRTREPYSGSTPFATEVVFGAVDMCHDESRRTARPRSLDQLPGQRRPSCCSRRTPRTPRASRTPASAWSPRPRCGSSG